MIACAVLGSVLLGSCGNDQKAANTANGTQHAAPDGARLVAEVAPDQLVAAILDECHRPLQARMQQVKIRVTLPGDRQLLVQADLPDRGRISEGRRDYLWRDGKPHRLDTPDPAESDADEQANRQLVAPLMRIADAAAFGPLYRAKTCEKDGDDYVLTDTAGTKTRLRVHAGTLLPRSISYGDQTVRIDDYLRTTSTWVANKVTLAPLGTCDVFFEDGGILIPDDFFDLPSERATNGNENIRIAAPGTVRERESTTPMLVKGSAARWVLLRASDDWQSRHDTMLPVHRELERQNQRIFGFPMYWQEGDKSHFAIPFKQREDGPALAAPADWQISGSKATKMLVVYPDQGDVAERIRAGTELLERALTNRKLEAIGPIVAQPFLHLQNGVPNQQKLNKCKVRMSVRVQ